MNRAEISEITHGDISLLNPIASPKLDEVVALLELNPGARVVDIGSGRGEVLMRVAETYEVEATGVDVSLSAVEQARRRTAGRGGRSEVRFVHADAATIDFGINAFDLAINVGSSHALGGYRSALQRLFEIVRPGGLVLFGEGFWRRAPNPDYLAQLGPGATGEELADYSGLITSTIEAGFTPLYVVESSREDWDRYEWTLIRNGELFAAGNPDVEGVDELVEWVRRARDRYSMPGGRDTLGFALLLLRRP